MKLTDINLLLDKAEEMCGKDYRTAKQLGVAPQLVCDWRAGRKNPQPEDIALIASVAGLDAEAWALRAMVEKHEGTAKGDRLMKAVGKALLVTGAGIGSAGAHAAAIFSSTSETVAHFIRCILC
jgi:DNA-binding transcriptional regulator YdaS (Cro superfamily)